MIVAQHKSKAVSSNKSLPPFQPVAYVSSQFTSARSSALVVQWLCLHRRYYVGCAHVLCIAIKKTISTTYNNNNILNFERHCLCSHINCCIARTNSAVHELRNVLLHALDFHPFVLFWCDEFSLHLLTFNAFIIHCWHLMAHDCLVPNVYLWQTRRNYVSASHTDRINNAAAHQILAKFYKSTTNFPIESQNHNNDAFAESKLSFIHSSFHLSS